MSTNGTKVSQALDLIHEELRRAARVEADLRRQCAQTQAALELERVKTDEQAQQLAQLRAALARKFVAGGVDLTGIVQVGA